MTLEARTPTPAQLQTAHVLGELADRIDAALTRTIAPVQPVTDSTFVIQGFLRELRHTAGRLSDRINMLGRASGPLSSSGGDASTLLAVLDDIERQTWYLIGLVESFLSKRFPYPFSDLRPYVAKLGEKAQAQVRNLYRQFVEVVRNPPAHADGSAVSLQMTLDVEVEVGRLIRQMEKLSMGVQAGMSVDLGRPPSGSPRGAESQPTAADVGWSKLWPVLGIVLGCLVLGVVLYYYWGTLLIVGLGLLVLGLLFKYPWAFIIAMLLGGN